MKHKVIERSAPRLLAENALDQRQQDSKLSSEQMMKARLFIIQQGERVAEAFSLYLAKETPDLFVQQASPAAWWRAGGFWLPSRVQSVRTKIGRF